MNVALYVVATPIGNLADLSLRARQVLGTVSWIAAEDTRHAAPLLKQLGATAKVFAAHEHNEREAAGRILALLAAGETVALISDAGTPGISDPGAKLVAAVRAAGFAVVPIPGACAAVTALSASGMPAHEWLFCGFLPPKSGQRQKALADFARLPYALVFYEAPHRILACLADLAAALGDRTLTIARELTKTFEQIHTLPLAEAAAWLEADANRQRGEFVLIVWPSTTAADETAAEGARILHLLLSDGLPVKQAAKLAAQISGGSKNALYAQALEIQAANSQ
ncbi:MAG: 16S rRNA (cytidine(1402)-2'-O)-methyltransferase [Zoogloeaceae bacterium]|jgi:16S rRNA (cytidine1402-2'-O)-methyltransferase|nr:16S rRNA (cytidine(1402)-2'-O)-methyltransferase [Zoogloeaceae bacterium]